MDELYAYATVLKKQDGCSTTIGNTLGYITARNKDEVTGVAMRRAQECKPGFDVSDVTVIEIDLEAVREVLEGDTTHD